VAQSYVRQSRARLEDARDALQEENFPYAVRLSQESVELSAKAVLKGVGIEYPKVHDVSDVFTRILDRFPEWFRENVGFLQESSRLLFRKREPSLYGDEDALISPERR
jgi:HEPN domain-containing protein